MKNFIFLTILILFSFFVCKIVLAEHCIDINTAEKKGLMQIRHIGEARAEQIIELRQKELFYSTEDLSRVMGIGPSRISDIKEQGLTCFSKEVKPYDSKLPEKQAPLQVSQETNPKIILSYVENNPVNQEIEISFSVTDLDNKLYDLKLSIEKEGVLSLIYNEAENKWQSSHYYLNKLFSNSSFEKTFRLKIREENINFQGKADIIVRIRQSNKSNYLEHKEEINFVEPKKEAASFKEEKGLADISKSFPASSNKMKNVSFFALILSLFSAFIILIFKKKINFN